jgi:hypothetical protein
MCYKVNSVAAWLPDTLRALTKTEVSELLTGLYSAPLYYFVDETLPMTYADDRMKKIAAAVTQHVGQIDDLFTLELVMFNVLSKRFDHGHGDHGDTTSHLQQCIESAECMAKQSTLWTNDKKDQYGNTTIDRQIYTALFCHPDCRFYLHFCPILQTTFGRQMHYIMEMEASRIKRHLTNGNCRQTTGTACKLSAFGPFDCEGMHPFMQLLKTKAFVTPDEALEFLVNVTPFLTCLSKPDQRTAGKMCGIVF